MPRVAAVGASADRRRGLRAGGGLGEGLQEDGRLLSAGDGESTVEDEKRHPRDTDGSGRPEVLLDGVVDLWVVETVADSRPRNSGG